MSDAVALLMALRDPGVELLAITVVAGNVPLDQVVQNAFYTVELAGSSVPVYAGCAAPPSEPLHTAEIVHGQAGPATLTWRWRRRESGSSRC